MMDELAFRAHQARVWLELDWWGYSILMTYPFASGLVLGVLAGFYAEPLTDWVERTLARRAMRKKLLKRK